MTISIRRLALLAGLILPLAGAGAGFAQTPPPPPGAGGGPHHHDGHAWGDPAAHAKMRADHLRAVLQLTPDQEPALAAFVASMAPPEGGMDHHGMGGEGRPPEDAGLTTPQRLDHMLAHVDAMHAKILARVEATKRFYAQLTASQQKAFDAIHMDGGHRHGGMGHRGMGHGFDHHGGPDGKGGPGTGMGRPPQG